VGRQTQASQVGDRLFAMMIRLLAMLVLAGLALGQKQLPMEPIHDSGQSVTGAFEGWFKNSDGTFSILLGYFNRNLREELDIPIGPDNRIEPGGPDRGQPTHFMPRRQWGMFTVKVPANFGDAKLTWTLTANHQTTAIPFSLNPLWEISPFKEEGIGNTPPSIAFQPSGPWGQGPILFAGALAATIGEPATLPVWVTDDAKSLSTRMVFGPPVILTWSKFRGPGRVTFSNSRPTIKKDEAGTAPFSGSATTTATFSEPGDYTLHLMANDWSGDGGRGFQCCWTTGQLKVSVKPARGGGLEQRQQ
jgi:hypothetical protein